MKEAMTDTMSVPTIHVDFDGTIGTITFCRPDERNPIGAQLIDEFDRAVNAAAAKPQLRALVITGSGKCFLSGGDIRMMRQSLSEPFEFFRLHDRLTAACNRLARLPIPVIAALNGHALGGGLELALACDIRILSDTARVGFPEIAMGIMPAAGGTARLARLIGRERALYLELIGEPIGAAEALQFGLVARVVASEQVLHEAMALARRLAAQAPAAVAMIKRAVMFASDMPLEGAVDYCQAAGLLLAGTRDCQEGMSAFLEKRPPKWQGS